MDLVVLKFGGSSVKDNESLNLVVDKIKEFYDKKKKIIVIVSAQGKTTDKLLREAKELDKNPNSRELDVLLSTGEQITMSKLSILLNKNNIPAISLTGWQAGIITNENHQNALIQEIDISRIEFEFKKRNIVILAGFQGINKNNDITTLGRGGSDTTAVAIAAKLKANGCYIFSDVEGIFTADPKVVKNSKKLDSISYDEMIDIANEGAKVLHNRCVEIGKEYGVEIIAKSTFNNEKGTIINNNIENTGIKSIVKRNVSRISIIGNGIMNDNSIIKKVINSLDELNIDLLNIEISKSKISIMTKAILSDSILEELHERLI